MFSLTSEDEWNPESANVDSFLIKTAPLTCRWVDVKIYLSIKIAECSTALIYVYTPKSCHWLWKAFPSPAPHQMCSAEIQPGLHRQGCSQDLITASQPGATGHCLSSLIAPALWQEQHCWSPRVIEMLIASRRMSAAALAWLREKPRGSYPKGDEDPPYQSHWFQPSLCFLPLEEKESSESVLHSLVQPDTEKLT